MEQDGGRPEYHFNSQPHKEADNIGEGEEIPYSISTHSLTRRLTSQAAEPAVEFSISTHSLTRRLTTTVLVFCGNAFISTHSLTRRLTTADNSVISSQ